MSKLFLTESEARILDLSGPAQAIVGAGSAIREMQNVKPFHKSFIFPGGSGDGTIPVVFLSEAEVGSGKAVIMQGYQVKNGPVTWAGGDAAELTIFDTQDVGGDARLFVDPGLFIANIRAGSNGTSGGTANLAFEFDSSKGKEGGGLRMSVDAASVGSESDLSWEVWGVIVDV